MIGRLFFSRNNTPVMRNRTNCPPTNKMESNNKEYHLVEACALDFLNSDRWPNELRLLVVPHLSPKDLIRCIVVCKSWQNSLKDELYWKIKIPQYFLDYNFECNGNYSRLFTRGGVHLTQTFEHLQKFMADDDKYMKSFSFVELYDAKIDTDLGFRYTMTNKRDYYADNIEDMRKFIIEAVKFDCPYLSVPTKYFEDGENFYLVFDNQFEQFGKYIKSIPKEAYNEKLVVKLVRQLIHAIQYLHDRNFCLISYFGGVDFGIKRLYNDIQLQIVNYTCNIAAQTSLVPACHFVSPERIESPREPPNSKSDLFSLGSLTYYFLTGSPPYNAHPLRVLYMLKNFTSYKIQDPNNELSELAKDFILRLLKRNLDERMTLEEALIHPWLTDVDPRTTPLTTARPNLCEFFDEE